MFCKNCGKEMTEDEKFCQECGTAVDSQGSSDNTVKATEQKKKAIQKPAIIVALVAVLLMAGIASAVALLKPKGTDHGADVYNIEAAEGDFELLCDLFEEIFSCSEEYQSSSEDAGSIAVMRITDTTSGLYEICCDKYGLEDKEVCRNSESTRDPEERYTNTEGYIKYPVEAVEWIAEYIFCAVPKEDHFFYGFDVSGEKSCEWYKDKDSYYSKFYVYGSETTYDAVVNNYELLSDGSYKLNVAVNAKSIEERYFVGEYEIIASLNTVDGKKVWSFKEWKNLRIDSYYEEGDPVYIPDEQTTTTAAAVTTTTATTSGKPEISGDRKIYYDYFYSSRFGVGDIVCFADVTHDGKDDMILGNITSRGWEKLYVFTIKNGTVEKLLVLTTLSNPKLTVFLTNTSGKCNIVIENKDIHLGHGTASVSEFYVTETGEIVEVNSFSQTYGSPIPYDTSEKSYQNTVTQNYGEGYSSLYYFYNNEFQKQQSKFFDTSPMKVFSAG